ncbi:amphi-Trp domain-containing protein [Haloparvum sp. AD34]
MTQEYESELTATREQVAAALSGVADGVLAGSIRLGDGDDAVAVDAPEELDLEIELETEGNEVSLEVELEWEAADVDDAEPSPIDEVPPEDVEVPPAADAESAADDAPAADAAATEAAALVGAADATQSLARFEVFRDRSNEWRWRLRHRNGNVIATSGEGYTRKHNAWKGLRSVMGNASAADVTELDET